MPETTAPMASNSASRRSMSNRRMRSLKPGSPGRRIECTKLEPLRKLVTRPQAWAANHLDVQLTELFAQGIAVQAQDVGSLELVASSSGQGAGDQRSLDLAQDAIVHTRCRQTV